jgi:hypothetical protein
MALLRRRSTSGEKTVGKTAGKTSASSVPASSVATSTSVSARGATDEPKAGGKGRPTPKRSEARAARAHGGTALSAPANRKEGRAQARTERRRKSQEYRAAMMSGDISKLPERERAPARILARDFVDSRINVGPFFLLVAAVYFVGGVVPNIYVRVGATYLMLVGILAVIVDTLVLTRQVTKRVAAKYPDSRVRVRAYAAQRALLPRRWRMPRPRVSRGD